TCMPGYFFRTEALVCSTCWPGPLTSELSSSKNNGRSGESRFKSSIDFDVMSPSVGIGGTGTGSLIGCGGPGGGPGAGSLIPTGAGGCGRATGGLPPFLHPAMRTVTTRTRTINAFESRFITRHLSLVTRNPVLLRPIRRPVVAVSRDLTEVAPVLVDGEDLAAARARRHECQVAAVRRPRRAFIAAFAKRDLPRLAGADVQDLDVEAGTRARGER